MKLAARITFIISLATMGIASFSPSIAATTSPKASADERARQIWVQALREGSSDKIIPASEHLQQLLDLNQKAISEDLIYMTAARLMYQAGSLDKAISYYERISRTSDFWLEAIEEKAWAYTLKKDYDAALGPLQTLLVPMLAPQIGPEPYFLQSLIDLKICNYNGVFETFKHFKTNYKPRVEKMEALKTQPNTPIVNDFLNHLQKGLVSQSQIGVNAQFLPRLANRDVPLISSLRAGRRDEAYNRLKQLAQFDIDEIAKIIKRMQVVEIEAIQHMHEAKPVSKIALKDQKAATDQLRFPYSGEVWLDELDHYKVSSNRCSVQGEKNELHN